MVSKSTSLDAVDSAARVMATCTIPCGSKLHEFSSKSNKLFKRAVLKSLALSRPVGKRTKFHPQFPPRQCYYLPRELDQYKLEVPPPPHF